ncbi:imm11 family protein [Dongia sp. agr-C8]
MAWMIKNVFCQDERYSPAFYFPDQDAHRAISASIRNGARVDPVPVMVARRRDDDDYVRGAIPDFLTIASKHVASEGFRQVVEELEPGLHQFIPVTLYDRGEIPVGKPYFIVNALTIMDVLLKSARIAELRAAGMAPSREELIARGDSSYEMAERSAVEGRHLWRPTFPTDLFFSDQLMLQIRRARLRKLTAFHVYEV